jgi:YegS/Rv2252/BmrU family lipid kinase
MSPQPRTLVIVNPHAAGGSARRRWRRIEPRVREALGAVEIEHTRAARDAERLAREAVRAGIERLVVAGGDGTVAEVASGLLRAQLGGYAEIALLPMGTGCDLAASLGIPRDPGGALAVIGAGKARRVDAGHARYVGRDGGAVDSYFLNVASFGVSGLVVELARQTARWLGGASFGLATLRALGRYRSSRVSLRIDGEPAFDELLLLGAVANGRQFGGGMRIAPQARLDDGCLEVVCIVDTPVLRVLPKLPKLYGGTLLGDPIVRSGRGRRIEADAAPGSVMLELDGEPLGTLPAQLELLPGALAIVGPA